MMSSTRRSSEYIGLLQRAFSSRLGMFRLRSLKKRIMIDKMVWPQEPDSNEMVSKPRAI